MLTMREFLNIKESTCIKEFCDGMALRTKKTFFVYFLIPSFLVLLVSYLTDLFYYKHNPNEVLNLFSRAGSLVVILFVAIEFRLYRHIARYERVVSTSGFIQLNGKSLTPEEACDYCEKYLSDSRGYRYLLALGGLMGTLIWGYGDIFIAYP